MNIICEIITFSRWDMIGDEEAKTVLPGRVVETYVNFELGFDAF